MINPILVDCGEPPKIVNGYLEQGSANYGTIRRIFCYEFFELPVGALPQIRCESNGRWSTAAACQMRVTTTPNRRCSNLLPALSNGFIHNGGNNIGDIRQLECFAGYQLVGNNKAICSSDATWRIAAECLKISTAKCNSSFPKLPRGKYLSTGFSAATFSPGDIMPFQCESQFRLLGNGYIQCEDNGEWSKKGVCRRVSRPPTTFVPSTSTRTTPLKQCLRCNVPRNPSLVTELITNSKVGNVRNVRNLLNQCGDPDVGELSTSWKPIMWAANNEHLEVVKELLSCNASVDILNSAGSTALMFASKSGNQPLVEVLLDAGANPNITNKFGSSALLFAAQNGKSDVVAVLLDHGANVDWLDGDGNSALVWAVRGNHTETVEVLLENGVNVNSENKRRDTALHFAAKGGYLEIIKKLLAEGARTDLVNSDGKTALQMAQDFGQLQAAIMLGGSVPQPADYYEYFASRFDYF